MLLKATVKAEFPEKQNTVKEVEQSGKFNKYSIP
jgi:hypothetical protein